MVESKEDRNSASKEADLEVAAAREEANDSKVDTEVEQEGQKDCLLKISIGVPTKDTATDISTSTDDPPDGDIKATEVDEKSHLVAEEQDELGKGKQAEAFPNESTEGVVMQISDIEHDGLVPPLTLSRSTVIRGTNLVPGAFSVAGMGSSRSPARRNRGMSANAATTSSTSAGGTVVGHSQLEIDPLHAELVPEEAETTRDPSQSSAVELSPVIEGTAVEGNPKSSKPFHVLSTMGILLMVMIILIMSLGLSGVFSSTTSVTTSSEHQQQEEEEDTENSIGSSSTVPLIDEAKRSKLEEIRERGILRAGFILPETDGLQASLLRAIAKGIIGPEGEIELVDTPLPDMFSKIINGTIDVILFGATHTMDRDVYMESTQATVSFSIPYNYEGLRIGGVPEYVKCVDQNFKHIDECEDLKVCVTAETTHREVIAKYLPQRRMVESDWEDGGIFSGLINRECNVIADMGTKLAVNRYYLSMGNHYEGEFALSENYLSNDPQAVVTANNEPELVDTINAILWSLLVAERENITQATAESFPQTTLFGEDHKDMFRDAIAVHGNFGEIYESTWGKAIPRSALNQINMGDANITTGLLYSHPFGAIGSIRDENAPLGATLTAILQRGKLRCGIHVGRSAFATRVEEEAGYSGMDVDFCKAVSASLFSGDLDAVEFVEVEEDSDGYILLSAGTIDVLAGATWTLQNDVMEPNTQQGYTFSQPYFYGYSSDHDNFCLATRQGEDEDWSRLVYWVVSASIFAEEEGIDAVSSHQMPEVFVYGPAMKRMFRDVVLQFGNYADMYRRNLEALYPRSGRNQVNGFPNTGPQHYPVPGFM
ncbi:extracellular solute-binding protein [Seminavis robusta]|uniref:Extracellular solute-binding protein n=1 Tax=Seminavis robusta TaxID=568900 RepID=A0A9N8HVC8_9STRA|nr:extracellular solute-binding protein [Seminavis robusta]|eukprot:Sro1920_g305520.1 extracellular solute-binding protein (827) ;mRNA; r:15132-17791